MKSLYLPFAVKPFLWLLLTVRFMFVHVHLVQLSGHCGSHFQFVMICLISARARVWASFLLCSMNVSMKILYQYFYWHFLNSFLLCSMNMVYENFVLIEVSTFRKHVPTLSMNMVYENFVLIELLTSRKFDTERHWYVATTRI